VQHLARRSLPRFYTFGPWQWAALVVAAIYTIATPPPAPAPQLTEPDPVTVEAVLDAPVRWSPEWASVTAGRLRLLAPEGDEDLEGRIKLSGPPDALSGLAYGDVVRLTANVRPPRGFRNPGLFDYGAWLERQNLIGVATIRPGMISRIGHRSSPIFDPIYAWRERIRVAALASLPAPTAAIFLAMITGETGYLTEDLRDRFMASGTVHLLSISGSHLGLIALVVFFVVRWVVRWLPERLLLRVTLYVTPSQIAAVVTLVPVTVYALLAGGQIATLRALVMIVLYLLAVLIHREDDLFNTLALAAILILVWNPHALRDVSFQLSFLSVLCIALGVEWWKARLEPPAEDASPTWRSRLTARIALLLITSIAAGVGTAPLVAHHFNQVNWVGLAANPIIIPLAGALVVPLGLASGLIAAVGNLPTLPWASLNTAALDVLLGAVDAFAAWPLAVIHVAAPSLAMIAFGYILLAILLDRRLQSWKRGLAVGVLVLLIVPWLAGAPRWSDPPGIEVTFLDVGQGDGAVIRFPTGRVMVIDGGTRFHELDVGRMVVAPTLWNQGVRRIDYLVASHPQLDHIGGLPYLIERFEVGEAWTNGRRPEQWAARRFDERLAARGIPQRTAVVGEQPLWIGAARVWSLNAWSALPFAPNDQQTTENDRSIVLRVEYGRASILFTGDLETAAERGLAGDPLHRGLLRSTVIKVPHHGSRRSLDRSFLRAVAPSAAVVSVGATNTYGHPTPEMLAAYRRLKTPVFRTDQDGAVRLVCDGTHLSLYRYHDLTPASVAWDRQMVAAEWRNLRTIFGAPEPAMTLDLSETELPI
jgi:competence protein ComEC